MKVQEGQRKNRIGEKFVLLPLYFIYRTIHLRKQLPVCAEGSFEDTVFCTSVNTAYLGWWCRN